MNPSFFVHWDTIIRALKKEGFMEALHILNVLLETKKSRDIKLFINFVVEAEILKRLFTRKRVLTIEEIGIFLSVFEKLPLTEDIEKSYLKLVDMYLLNPYDALVIMTCKHYEVKYLVTQNSKLVGISQRLGLIPVSSAERLGKILAKELQKSIF